MNEARKRNLLRFIHAQENGGIYDNTSTYSQALEEIKRGHKKTHWIWYIFPQMKGLGKSEISQFYGIDGREEAKAYIEHPILREHYISCCQAILDSGKSAYEIFGGDVVKVRASLLLMNSVWKDNVIRKVLMEHHWL